LLVAPGNGRLWTRPALVEDTDMLAVDYDHFSVSGLRTKCSGKNRDERNNFDSKESRGQLGGVLEDE
jgi:hypothetical protein